MNQAKLNTQLYQKMFAEQKLYRAGLLLLPPSEILNHAYEYVCIHIHRHGSESHSAATIAGPLDTIFVLRTSSDKAVCSALLDS